MAADKVKFSATNLKPKTFFYPQAWQLKKSLPKRFLKLFWKQKATNLANFQLQTWKNLSYFLEKIY